jgi:hypothetical protein
MIQIIKVITFINSSNQSVCVMKACSVSYSIKIEKLNTTQANSTIQGINGKGYNVRILFTMQTFQGWVLIASCSQMHWKSAL